MQEHLDDWNKFEKTGNIKDYLRFRGVSSNSLFDDEHSSKSQPSLFNS